MLTQALLFIMLEFMFGFAQIGADAIPDGVMPKRQVAGTGVTPSSSTPTSTKQTSTKPTSSNPQPTSTSSSKGGGGGGGNSGSSSSNNGGSSQSSQSSQSSNDNTSSQEPSSTSVPVTIKVTTTNSDGSKVTTHVSTNTLEPGGAVATVKGSKNSVVRIGSTTIDPKTLSHKTVITSALISKHTQQHVYTSYWTSDGHVYSKAITTDQVFDSTTGYATATIAPSLADGGGNGSNLSSNSKAVIGGVVGGIGGAVLIGGLAFVAWRLYGKKRQDTAGDDPDGSQNDSIREAKRGSNMTFDTDRYRNPGGPVNTSSNF